ncbi:LOW QUALITY PROTEIN: protein-glutamine gamma-glutamyltransferase 2-like [Pristis pectinata]|uniref:LOW QUALITY PROTEIN: protein-glutamine gamma-glutamyltransferase 2-like n=1 Tax=Pristis pectinata TaxID=685728 RepID=UPI00223D0361|nr:LOW QUALITY PROTEIN: protein-glutamine gamma-glutamyltransferase 2-like [Pristis pectinata]
MDIRDKCQVDFQYEKNNKEHRTIEISTKRLIVRRGQSFNIKVNFKDGFNPQEAKLNLILETGREPQKANNTSIVFPFTESINVKRWSAVISSATTNELCLAISPSPKAIIGYYTLILQHSYKQNVKYHLGTFVVLFNPWCSEDEVFLNSDVQRNEYLLNENGIIYVGGSDYISDKHWNFGQFEDDILDICLKLLDNTPKFLKTPNTEIQKRNSAVFVARTVSAMVNSQDDRGILHGRWSPPYSDGVVSRDMNGSGAILRQWNASDCKAVRYGQCWVFAAVTCTVLRCLGIPTRVVTNFDSAHDADANLTIDDYYNIEGDDVGGSSDSVWNFHVWNECWMARTDLTSGFDGWQVVDATPQELSGGVYCCGPAPVKAVKEGDMDMKYDVPFVFAEVNAHCVKWLLFSDGTKMQVDVDTEHVGHKVSTKRCGADEREDITDTYKYPDGSTQEADVFAKANMIQNIPPPKKTLQVSLLTDQPSYIGKPVSVSVVIFNKSSKEKVYNVRLWAKKRKYNGGTESQCFKKHKEEVTIASDEAKKIALKVSYQEYGLFPDMYNLMKLITVVTDVSSQDNASAVKDVALINPPITIKMLNYFAQVNKTIYVTISFKNPFPDALKNCVMTLEGKGLIEGAKEIKFGDVAANEDAEVKCDFVPHKSGKRKLLVDFDSNLLQNAKGSLVIDVQEK